MKNLYIVLLLVTSLSYAQNGTVQPFLPEIISQFPNVRDISVSSNGNEIYFSVQSYMSELSTIIVIKKEHNNWSKPKVVSFSGQFHDIEPFLSPDGLKLYYASNRPLINSSNETKDFDIWFVERKSLEQDWSEPINIGVPINTSKNEFYPTITNSNNLYFTSDGETSKGKDDIFISKYVNGKYTTPVSLSASINSTGYEFNAFVSPDETMMIYTAYNRKDGFGSGDLFVSYKNDNNEWSVSKNLGKSINSNKMDYCPFVDIRTNTLYITSKRNETRASFSSTKSLSEFLNEMNNYSNGLSRLYSIPFIK